MARYAKPAHKRAAKVLGYALTLDDVASWNGASAIWAAHLSLGERAALAMAALHSLGQGEAEVVVEQVFGGAGSPLPTFIDPLDEAQWWADLANLPELRAYALAAFMALPLREKRDFLAYVREATT